MMRHKRRQPVKSAVETLSPTRAKLTVEVPFEELKPSLDAATRARLTGKYARMRALLGLA
jgi:hypothetical protein